MAKSRAITRRRVFTRSRVHHKKKFTLPLAIVLGFAPAVVDVIDNVPGFGIPGSILHTGAGLMGYDTVGKRYAGLNQAKAAGLYPLLLGFGVHWAASKFGINRMIARAGIPLIRI